MSNLEHELMAAERALKAIAEMTGADYVAFHFHASCHRKFSVNIHNNHMVRADRGATLNEAFKSALVTEPFDATPKEEKAA